MISFQFSVSEAKDANENGQQGALVIPMTDSGAAQEEVEEEVSWKLWKEFRFVGKLEKMAIDWRKYKPGSQFLFTKIRYTMQQSV